jgi:hypothetical protein
MKPHRSITKTRIIEACDRYHRTLDNPGFCLACGLEVDGVEPDARERQVYGAEELLMRLG